MSFIRRFVVYKVPIAIAIVAFVAAPTYAQEVIVEPIAETESTESTEEIEEIEEIIVFAPKPGDRRRVDEEYEDPIRAQLLKDFYEMEQLEEEYQWRQSAADDSSSRIKWGYDPRDDYRRRNEMELLDLAWEMTKPATVFSFELYNRSNNCVAKFGARSTTLQGLATRQPQQSPKAQNAYKAIYLRQCRRRTRKQTARRVTPQQSPGPWIHQ